MSWAWFDEGLGSGYRLGLEVAEKIHAESTGQQTLEIYRTTRFGRILSLNGIIQTTERDEFIYHEMLAHVPILAHGAAREVGIVGGGDGGTLREVLKHGIERVTLVEIDPRVIELCRVHLPSLSAGTFDDPRAHVVIADGAEFVAAHRRRFDVLIIDSTDPIGPGEILFTERFYKDCKKSLTDGGVLVTQNGVPMVQASELSNSYRRLRNHFADVTCYLAPVPTYFGGHMAFGWATDDPKKRRTAANEIERRCDRAVLETRYYNPAVHAAAFALPNYISRLLDNRSARGASHAIASASEPTT